MKILVLSYEYPPIGGGGGEICRNISENLAKIGNEVTVLTTAFDESKMLQSQGNIQPTTRLSPLKRGTSLARGETEGVSKNQKSHIKKPVIIRLPSKRKNAFQSNPVEMLSWITTTKKYIKNNPGFVDFNVCMAHFVLPGGEVAYWLKKQFGLPYVLISHGHEIPWVHPRQMFFFHLGTYFWIKKVCKYSEINFIQTKKMKANIDRFLGKKYWNRNIIVTNGVDTEYFQPDFSKRGKKLRIIFVGRLVIQKDPMTFLKAIRHFSQNTRDFEVHIMGDGNLRKKMEKFVQKNGLSKKVHFRGKISRAQMLAEYQAAHLLVAPSLNEGMSIAALEALCCGVYLIASRASGFEDMIEEGVNGEFCGFGDWKNLCGLLHKFNKYRNRTAGNTKNNRIFEWKSIVNNYMKIMQDCS